MRHEQGPDHVRRFETDVIGLVGSTICVHEFQRIDFHDGFPRQYIF